MHLVPNVYIFFMFISTLWTQDVFSEQYHRLTSNAISTATL